MIQIATTPSVNQVSLLTARIIPISTSITLTVKTRMKPISSRMSTQQMATSRPGRTGLSSITVTISETTKAITPMASTRIIHTTTEAMPGTIPGTTEARAGMIPSTTIVIGMATTRPAIMNLSMLTRRAQSSIGTILRRVHTRGTRRMTRTLRRLRRRNLTMSPSARAGTRSSLLQTTEFLSGKTAPPMEILSSSH